MGRGGNGGVVGLVGAMYGAMYNRGSAWVDVGQIRVVQDRAGQCRTEQGRGRMGGDSSRKWGEQKGP